ncbi:unnamed protein product [Vitrella brassicaformis CCMP3155]|uniref:Uncharacterized protein n=1 Tax=Vitrella brassicaformis (strain CCMP3155) TaxID=1169540 RepID=A0A0G4GQM7_VITBC|nr:unnamed protein product [Vitrella brassicaformis CCMP3155]|eukprot:CEM32773.1 unnamed protein product [Vitrella brassicaformis CCMP3155]
MRDLLPAYRQLTDNQQFHIVDRLQNKRYDAVTLFDVRPPELHFIGSIEEYVKLSKMGCSCCIPSFTSSSSPWQHWTCSGDALPEATKNPATDSAFFHRFVEYGKRSFSKFGQRLDTIVVMSHVAPMNTGRFLNYVLLMLGRFVCEKDLFFAGNLQKAFYRARLVTSLSFAGTRWRSCASSPPAPTCSVATISDVLLRNTIAYPGTPLVRHRTQLQ